MTWELHHGDARDRLPELPRIDTVITDPPYGIGFPYNGYDDTKENLAALVNDIMPILLAKANRIVITPGITNMHLYPPPDWVAAWTWDTTGTYGFLGYNQWQPIFVYGKDRKGFGSVDGQLKADRIHFSGQWATTKGKESEGHACSKPIAFVERLVARFTDPTDTIVDPFAGSGTTGVAAQHLGRNFVGIEQNAEYAAIARRRLANAHAQPFLIHPKNAAADEAQPQVLTGRAE